MKNFLLKTFLMLIKNKAVIAITGILILGATAFVSIYIAKTNVEAETIVNEIGYQTETEAKDTVEDIGLSEEKQDLLANVDGTYYADVLGASIAISSTTIPDGTKLSVKTYSLDESPVATILKNNTTISKIYSLYNFELINNDKVITLVDGAVITATFKVPENSTEFLALCYVDYVSGNIEFNKGTIKDGYVSFNLTHFSFYSLVEMDKDNYYAQFGMPLVADTSTAESGMGDVGTVAVTTPAMVTEPTLAEISGMVHGIDISRWQGTIDWSAVKASGIKFVIIKACGVEYGDGLYIDRNFTNNIEGALAVGLQVGVYAYSDMPTEADTLNLANQIIDLVQGYRITYPIVFDFESSAWPVTKTELTNLAILFCDTVKAAGYNPMVYTNQNYLYNKYNADSLFPKYRLWLATYFYPQYYGDSYDGHWYQYDILPEIEWPFQMWQYASQGHVPGIAGHVDLNVAFFSYSGTSVSTSELKLNVTNTNITANVDSSPNLLNGVTATNTIGINVSGSVTYTFKDSSNQPITYVAAMALPGTYTVTYTIVDFTGGKLTKTATLVVRSRPLISGVVATYDMSSSLDLATIKANLLTGVTATSYEGVPLTSSLDVTGIPETITTGTYTVTFTVTDSFGLESSPTTAQLNLN